MVFGELTRWRIFGESFGNGFWRTDTFADLWGIFGEWFLANWRVSKSLANGFRRTDTLVKLWRMVFCELTRWRIFGESLWNGCWRTDTLANLWRMFSEWFLANWHVIESLANLWEMAFGELRLWAIFGETLGNGLWPNDTLANLSLIFGELFLAN